MTGALDTRMRATASRLLGKYGKAMTLTHTVAGTYNHSTGMTGSPSVTTAQVNGYVDDAFRKLGATYGPDLVQAGDHDVMFAALGLPFTPVPGDTITIDGQVMKAYIVKPTYSGEKVALYNLLVRV